MPSKLSRVRMESERLKMWQDLHHGASITVGDGDVMVIDILKLSLLSPLVKNVIKSLNVPNSLKHLLDVNIILPDFKSEDIGLLVEILDQTCCNVSRSQQLTIEELVRVIGLSFSLMREEHDEVSETLEMQVNSQDKRFFSDCSKIGSSSHKSINTSGSSSSKAEGRNVTHTKPQKGSDRMNVSSSSIRNKRELKRNSTSVDTPLANGRDNIKEISKLIDKGLPNYKSSKQSVGTKTTNNCESKEEYLSRKQVSRNLFEARLQKEYSLKRRPRKCQKELKQKFKDGSTDYEARRKQSRQKDIWKKNNNSDFKIKGSLRNSTFGTGSSSSGLGYGINGMRVGEPSRVDIKKSMGGESRKYSEDFLLNAEQNNWCPNEQPDCSRSNRNSFPRLMDSPVSRWFYLEEPRENMDQIGSHIQPGSYSLFDDSDMNHVDSETFGEWQESPNFEMYPERRVVERVDDLLSSQEELTDYARGELF